MNAASQIEASPLVLADQTIRLLEVWTARRSAGAAAGLGNEEEGGPADADETMIAAALDVVCMVHRLAKERTT